MQTKLSTPVLTSICADIAAGRPLWALMRMNEHLDDVNHPLYLAVRTRARQAICDQDHTRLAALSKISTGLRLSQLDVQTRRAATTEAQETFMQEAKRPPPPALRIHQSSRRGVLRSRQFHERKTFVHATSQKFNKRPNLQTYS